MNKCENKNKRKIILITFHTYLLSNVFQTSNICCVDCKMSSDILWI